MSNLGQAVLQLGSLFTGIIEIYIWVVIIAALLSFVNPDPYNPVVQFLHRITNPAYSLVKSYIKTNFNGIDLAPLVIIIGLQVVSILLTYVFNVLAGML
ncbi:MAG: YggT family protein [Sulfurimonas sp.]|uniref:YggT family protein n=1 Tax=Sulfurimonas sp. TaxID=2022749 RepID=UPI0026198C02|nr:YggT family protein [Sulfurimonas sp.]MCW8895170.1 YggT family protein [Sulfurimonas sp.]MCW8954869.1 YggT family protein [Sulfurimonas sp.]MCW9067753.1 YggT family protein [Sulfurimonas sp.]